MRDGKSVDDSPIPVFFHAFIAAGMAPEAISEPTAPMNARCLGLEVTYPFIVLHRRGKPAVSPGPVTISARNGARRAKDQIAVGIGRIVIVLLSETDGAATQPYETGNDDRNSDQQDGASHQASSPDTTRLVLVL
jgi:hypothetical protein